MLAQPATACVDRPAHGRLLGRGHVERQALQRVVLRRPAGRSGRRRPPPPRTSSRLPKGHQVGQRPAPLVTVHHDPRRIDGVGRARSRRAASRTSVTSPGFHRSGSAALGASRIRSWRSQSGFQRASSSSQSNPPGRVQPDDHAVRHGRVVAPRARRPRRRSSNSGIFSATGADLRAARPSPGSHVAAGRRQLAGRQLLRQPAERQL